MATIYYDGNNSMLWVNGMWVNGWLLGKYDKFREAPINTDEVAEWIAGFQAGCADVARYENWDILLKGFLEQYPELKEVRGIFEPVA